MYAITTNPIDIIVCITMVLFLIMCVAYRLYMENKHAKRMGWSPVRDDLRTMRRMYR